MVDGAWSDVDVRAMRVALDAAEHGRARVSPNPPVGCTLVRDGRIIATGWHDHLGGLHGEQAAIADAEARGEATNGAITYVTLEPCNHHGRTPPCTEALLWAGVREVVIAHPDPNPTVRGGGADALREAGIRVREGLLRAEAGRQMQAFLHWCAERRPLVTLKLAVDPHDRVDASSAPPGRFTSPASLDLAHRLRRAVDAIVVGVGTVIRDDPALTVRRVEPAAGRQPVRVVLDPRGRIPATAAVLTDGQLTLLVRGPEATDESSPAVPAEVVHLLGRPSDRTGLDLGALLDLLGDRGHQELLIEGGPTTWAAFLKAALVDRIIRIRSLLELGDGPIAPALEPVLTDAWTSLPPLDLDGDTVERWTRSDLPWPTDAWP